MKCKQPRSMATGTLTTKPTKNAFIRLLGRCIFCGTRMNKIVKPQEWGETHPLYVCMTPSLEQHNGVQHSQHKPSVEKGEQLCLNLIP